MATLFLSALLLMSGDRAAREPQESPPLEDKFLSGVCFFLTSDIVMDLDSLAYQPLASGLPVELLVALQSKDCKRRDVALQGIELFGEMAHTVARRRGTNDGALRFRLALGRWAPAFQQSLQDLAMDADAKVRCRACAALLALEPTSRPALLGVLVGMNALDTDFIKSLGRYRFQHKPIIVRLVAGLKHEGVKVRIASAWAAFEIGPAARATVPGLIELFKSGAAARVDFATLSTITAQPLDLSLAALGAMGSDAASAVPVLADKLESASDDECREILFCLARIGPAARKAAPAVRKLLGRRTVLPKLHIVPPPPVDVRLAAAATLLRLLPGDEQALSVVQNRLCASETITRRQALETCSALRVQDKSLVHDFMRALKIPDLCDAAADAIAAIGPEAAEAIPALTQEWLGGDSISEEWTSARALVRIGKASVPTVLKLARHRDPASRLVALWSLGEFPEAAPQALPILIDALADSDTRYAAVVALGLLGPRAREAAIPLLIASLVDLFGDIETQMMEHWALAQITR